MRATLSVLLLLTVAGCGAGPAATQNAKERRDKACAAGDGQLEVSDILDKAPPGLEIVEADEEKLRPLMDPLRKALGDRLRGFATKVVAKKGTAEGTAIMIANANESIGKPDDVIAGARRSAEENDGKFEEITVADKPAAFVDYGEIFQVSVQVGDCSVATLVDGDGERIRTVADALHPPS